MSAVSTTIVTTLDDVVSATDGELSLREAIALANGASEPITITFDPTLAGGTVTLTGGALEITAGVTINGMTTENPDDNIIISGNDNSRVFEIDLEETELAVLQNLSINDGRVAVGSEPGGGAGVEFTGAGSLRLESVGFVGNVVTGEGGSGGAIFSSGGLLDVVGSTFTENVAVRAGGAIEIFDTATVSLTDVVFLQNSAGNGGGVHVTTGDTVEVSDANFEGNFALFEGGGIWNNAGTTLTVDDTTFNSNTAVGTAADEGGAAIFNNGGDVQVDGSNFFVNMAAGTAGSGGAILSTAGALTVDASGFYGNLAARAGGAIEVIDGDLTVRGSVFEDNITSDPFFVLPNPGNGGAIHTTGAVAATIEETIFDANRAENEGGALWFSAGTEAALNNNSFAGNSAATDGGGIFMRNGAHVDVSGGTFADNEAVNGEAVFVGGPEATGGGLHFGFAPDADLEMVQVGDQTVVGGTGRDIILGDKGANVLLGGDNDDLLLPGSGGDLLTGGGGTDIFFGAPIELNGSNILDFTSEDAIAVSTRMFDRSMLGVAQSETSTILTIPSLGEGETVTLTGDFRDGNFLTGWFEEDDLGWGTGIAFLEFLPTLTEGVALASPVAPADQTAVELFLEGARSYDIVIEDALAGAAFRNAVGVYEIDSEGNISNVRIIDTDASDGGGASLIMSDGAQLGLFIIQNGAAFAEGLSDTAVLSFDSEGKLLVDEASTDEMVFHATRPDLNPDDLVHAVAGTGETDENVLLLGFEDQLDLGDGDYQDVVLRIETVDVAVG